MSYQVLARKYRPRSFRELVGQEHVARALINALDQDRLHHAYLFTGTRGVGKTTIARILAKCLNCETGVSSEPCGVCGTCCEVNEGRFIDLIEVDAASRTKVEDTRELLENVQYAPTRGRYKVYLIDEVHMLSQSSFNALLKTLEEPPPHVKFLLATTDPQKLPVTVLSRCLQFSLKAMSPERIVTHLVDVLQKEVVPFEEAALWELGRAANGSMRDALSLTDQAIAFGNGRLESADVRSMLGSIDRDLVFRVLEALNSGDASIVLAVTAQLAEQSVDFFGALVELVSALHHVALAQMQPDAVDNTMGERERILTIAQASTAEDIQLYYQIAIQGRRDMPYAADPRSGFEMTLLRMLAFRPVPSSPKTGQGSGGKASSAGGVTSPRGGGAAGNGGAQASGGMAASSAREMLRKPVEMPPLSSSPQMSQQASAAPVIRPSSAVQVAVQAQPVNNVIELPVRQPIAGSSPPKVSPSPEQELPIQPEALCTVECWELWVRQSGLAGNGLNLARHAALVFTGNNQFELQVAARNELVAGKSSYEQVEAIFRQQFPEAHLRLVLKDPAYMIPLQVIKARKEAQQAEAERCMREDPNVQAIIREFQAEILPNSIVSLER